MPLEVLEEAASELTGWHGKGISVLEMSHRSADFQKIYEECTALLRELYAIPHTHEVMFLQGGGHLQFAMVPLNLAQSGIGNYAVNGVWSRKAFKEAEKISSAAECACAEFRAPAQRDIRLSENASYLYYCSNETVNGIQYPYIPEATVPLVADISSDFLSKPLPIERFGLLFAGAQKNFGPAGLTVAIARKDLLGHEAPRTPTMLSYETYAKSDSMYNTPPTFAIYLSLLVARWIKKEGGVSEMQRRSELKSSLLYDVIDASGGFYTNKVEKSSRSKMNVVFNLTDAALEPLMIEEAKKEDIVSIKGHRILGGMRASLYNAVSIEDAQALSDFMKEFARTHG